MFDTEFSFEEFPIAINDVEVAMCSGTALLEGENGPHDYGFRVTGITLEGNLVGSYRNKRETRIGPKSDDPFSLLLFKQLAERIEADKAASGHFYAELEEHQATAFAA